MIIKILGTKVDSITRQETIELIKSWLQDEKSHYVLYASPRVLFLAQKDKQYQQILNRADLVNVDGDGLKAAAKFLTLPTAKNKIIRIIQALAQGGKVGLSLIFNPSYLNVITEKNSFSDLIWDVFSLASDAGKTVYFLGGDFLEDGGDTAVLAAAKAKKTLPNLKIVGAQKGESIHNFRISDQSLVERIKKANPDVLLIGFKNVYEARWINANLPNLPSVKIAIGVGGAFGYVAGVQIRAPLFFRRHGLEWLWRLLYQPWRAKNIYEATVKFCWAVFKEKINSF